MKFLLLASFLATAFLACQCQNPTRPSVSLFFDGRVRIEVIDKATNQTIRGDGFWINDQPKGLGLENFFFHNRSHRDDITDLYRLQRYDLGYRYSMDNATYCNKTKVTGSMPNEFAWVSQATYSGQRHFRNRTLDGWKFSSGYATMELYVSDSNVNIPIFLARDYKDYILLVEFEHFSAVHPDMKYFKVPDACNSARLMNKFYDLDLPQCEARSTMISRAQSWVDAHVPYNQGATYGGYREDCSGYVSMAWESSKPGHTTFDLNQIAHPITRAELQAGDVLLCASEHVVLFGGWVDSDHYTAFEETKPGEGTVKRTTPYPYWYNTACFLPYRYDSVC